MTGGIKDHPELNGQCKNLHMSQDWWRNTYAAEMYAINLYNMASVHNIYPFNYPPFLPPTFYSSLPAPLLPSFPSSLPSFHLPFTFFVFSSFRLGIEEARGLLRDERSKSLAFANNFFKGMVLSSEMKPWVIRATGGWDGLWDIQGIWSLLFYERVKYNNNWGKQLDQNKLFARQFENQKMLKMQTTIWKQSQRLMKTCNNRQRKWRIAAESSFQIYGALIPMSFKWGTLPNSIYSASELLK